MELVAPKDEVVLYQVTDGVAHIKLNRPDQINAFNIEMRDMLFQTLELYRDDNEAKVAIISGEGGRGFCAGADLTEFGTTPSQVISRDVRWERDLWGLFIALRKPIIAKLHGYVIGSGIEIAALCDIRVAADSSVFRMPEVALGMIPAAGGTQTLRNMVGASKALEIIMTNRMIDASEAVKIRLIDRIATEENLDHAVQNVARNLAELNPKLLSSLKSTVIKGLDLTMAQGIQYERRNFVQGK